MASSELARPGAPNFVDLLRSFPSQARLALGTRGVLWATFAGIVGVICCVVAFADIALSLHRSDVDPQRRQAREILALDNASRLLMRSILASSAAGQGAGATPIAGEPWRHFTESLATVCRDFEVSPQTALADTCAAQQEFSRPGGPGNPRLRNPAQADRRRRAARTAPTPGPDHRPQPVDDPHRRRHVRPTGRRLCRGAAGADAQHHGLCLRRARPHPAGRPHVDGLPRAMAPRRGSGTTGRRLARHAERGRRGAAGRHRRLRCQRAPDPVQFGGEDADAGAPEARRDRPDLLGTGARLGPRARGGRLGTAAGRGMDRALPHQDHRAHAPVGRRAVVRLVGEGHGERPHGRAQGRRHRHQAAPIRTGEGARRAGACPCALPVPGQFDGRRGLHARRRDRKVHLRQRRRRRPVRRAAGEIRRQPLPPAHRAGIGGRGAEHRPPGNTIRRTPAPSPDSP